MIRFTETKTRDGWGNVVREIRETDRAGPVATITTTPDRGWYLVTCALLAGQEGTGYAKGLPQARRLAYAFISHATARSAA